MRSRREDSMIPCTCLYYTLAAEPLAFEGSKVQWLVLPILLQGYCLATSPANCSGDGDYDGDGTYMPRMPKTSYTTATRSSKWPMKGWRQRLGEVQQACPANNRKKKRTKEQERKRKQEYRARKRLKEKDLKEAEKARKDEERKAKQREIWRQKYLKRKEKKLFRSACDIRFEQAAGHLWLQDDPLRPPHSGRTCTLNILGARSNVNPSEEHMDLRFHSLEGKGSDWFANFVMFYLWWNSLVARDTVFHPKTS